MIFSSLLSIRSHPVRVRGLKPQLCFSCAGVARVAPRAGAWIETLCPRDENYNEFVAPRAGAWIETEARRMEARPSQVAPRAGAWIETLS